MQGTYMAWEGVVYKHNCEVMAHTSGVAGGGSQQNQVGLWRAGDLSPTEAHLEERANLGTSAVLAIEWKLCILSFLPTAYLFNLGESTDNTVSGNGQVEE